MDDLHYDKRLIDVYWETGAESAFAELVQRNQNFVFRVAFAQTGDVQDAEEVAQETFLRLANGKARPNSQYNEAFRPWLCRVVTNVARSSMRRERRLKHRHTVYGTQARDCAQGDAATAADSHETHKVLATALSELSRESRELIVLHYLEGISQVELGRMKGLSQSSVSRRIEKGMEALRRQLAGAGVVATALELPRWLSDPALLQAPETLSRSLALLRHGPADMLASQSTRMPMRAARFKAAALLLGVAAMGAVLFHTMYSGSATQDIREPAPPAAAEAAPKAEERFYKRWTFDSKQDVNDLFGTAPGLALVSEHGAPGVGCVANLQPETVIQMRNIRVDRLPLRVRIRHKLTGASSVHPEMRIAANWSDDSYRVFGVFRNAGIMKHFIAGTFPWCTTECYLTENFIDEWLDGERSGVMYVRLDKERSTSLAITGPYLIDEIEVAEISPEDAPDLSPFKNFVSKIPQEKYFGSHPFQEMRSPRAGKTVYLEFLRSPAIAARQP